MSKAYLIIGSHNYLPVGTTGEIFSFRYENLYKPILKLLNEHDSIKIAFHISGVLFEWVENNHPEYFILLRDLIKRKQVEMLGGGFYEPVFSIIPNSDKLGQIEKLTTYIRYKFGKRPRGVWIPEMVWEPNMVYTLRNSGMEYTILNDNQFLLAGLSREEIYSPVILEEQGKVIAAFPNSVEILKNIITEEPERIIERIKSISITVDNPVIVLVLNDAYIVGKLRRFGSEYIINWFRRFFLEIDKNRDWLESVLPTLYLKDAYPLKRAYVPESSCDEMGYWALDTKHQREFLEVKNNLNKIGSKDEEFFVRAGSFRHFITKYIDVNLIYSRMIHTHLLVNQIRGDKYKKRSAQNELWKGQCNSVYWHGRDKGIYSNLLRKEVYRAFIEAEKIARTGNGFLPSIIVSDFDMDGCVEYLYQGKYLNAFVHGTGGMIVELDYFPVSWNYFDSVMRNKEPYHSEEMDNEGYDWYPRKSFVDHFFPLDTESKNFFNMQYHELGDFILNRYKLDNLNREKKILNLFRTGKLQIDGTKKLFKIEKQFQFKNREVAVAYKLSNLTESELSFVFGVEFNLGLPYVKEPNIVISNVDGKILNFNEDSYFDLNGVERVSTFDTLNNVFLEISSNSNFDVWGAPLYAYSYDENSLSREYQATTILVKWDISMAPLGKVSKRLSLKIGERKISR